MRSNSGCELCSFANSGPRIRKGFPRVPTYRRSNTYICNNHKINSIVVDYVYRTELDHSSTRVRPQFDSEFDREIRGEYLRVRLRTLVTPRTPPLRRLIPPLVVPPKPPKLDRRSG